MSRKCPHDVMGHDNKKAGEAGLLASNIVQYIMGNSTTRHAAQHRKTFLTDAMRKIYLKKPSTVGERRSLGHNNKYGAIIFEGTRLTASG